MNDRDFDPSALATAAGSRALPTVMSVHDLATAPLRAWALRPCEAT